jgi:hypothetical protein
MLMGECPRILSTRYDDGGDKGGALNLRAQLGNWIYLPRLGNVPQVLRGSKETVILVVSSPVDL